MEITKWLGVSFQSSAYKTEQFMNFVRDFCSALRQAVKGSEWNLYKFNTGHFYVSGFFQHIPSGRLIYFSISDVRFFPNEWYKNILVRTAESDHDWTGGMNHYTSLDELLKTLDNSINWL